MAKTFTTASGVSLKVRRLKWKEFKMYRKRQQELLQAGEDDTELVEEVISKVVEAPEDVDIFEELDVDEILRIFTYAMGGPEEDLQLKN